MEVNRAHVTGIFADITNSYRDSVGVFVKNNVLRNFEVTKDVHESVRLK